MKRYCLLFGCLFFITASVWSQNWADKGNKQFQALAYSEAIISLEKAVKKGNHKSKVYGQLAESYYYNANYQAAAKWYRLFFKNRESDAQKHYFQYAQALKSIGKYEDAAAVLLKMEQMFSTKRTIFSQKAEINKEDIVEKNAMRFEIELALFNAPVSDFGPSYFGSQIVFASARDTSGIIKRKHSWTNQSFTDLYLVNADSIDLKPTRFNKKINSKFNESTAVFSKDGTTMYFTRNNFDGKKRAFDKNKTTLLKIYKAMKEGQEWTIIGALPFCSDAFNVAHPALSPDEKTLFFSSDMPGGFGQSDLYKVEINTDGSFGKPENLGDVINSIGRETFPFISQNQELYFSSDGHESLGGLDILMSTFDENGAWQTPQNLPEPVNSRMDDFGFIINAKNTEGYFTSNRTGGAGMDDIYSFKAQEKVPCKTRLEGTIASSQSVAFLSGVEVDLLDNHSNLISKTSTDANGTYYFEVACDSIYQVQTRLKGYIPQQIQVSSKQSSMRQIDKIILEEDKIRFQVGDDLAKVLGLLPIYFDLGKSAIRSDAALELTKIKNTLLEYSTLTIEIRSHTDSRDTAKNNQKLSDQRAKATRNWLIQNGIGAERLKGVGFGETILLNDCVDGVWCEEAAHQLNRRSEFIVTGF